MIMISKRLSISFITLAFATMIVTQFVAFAPRAMAADPEELGPWKNLEDRDRALCKQNCEDDCNEKYKDADRQQKCMNQCVGKCGLQQDNLLFLYNNTRDLCSILRTANSWLRYTIPIFAFSVAVISGAFWVMSGAKEDFLTMTKNIILKIGVALAAGPLILVMLGFVANILSVSIDTTGSNCSLSLWKENRFELEKINENTIFSNGPNSVIMGVTVVATKIKGLAGLLGSIMIAIGFVQYVGSVGPEGATKARNTIMYAVFGLLIIYGVDELIFLFQQFL
ncbi:MAG: hypothetical protein NTZ80_02595 [Patescibacteria group bacterium]|nr:hypothetical protein [Patescibacteria group bacterium]